MKIFQRATHNKNWETDQAVLPLTSREENLVTIKNIRNFRYRTEFDYDVKYSNQVFDLNKIRSAIIGLVPFSKNPLILHALMKFEFEDNAEIVFSIEIRRTKGQKFSSIKTVFPSYELMYVIADSQDVVELRTEHRINEPVYFYNLSLSKTETQNLFCDMCQRTNKIYQHPEFFTLFWNSCTSNLVDHINKNTHYKIPWLYKYLAPGLLFKYFKIKK